MAVHKSVLDMIGETPMVDVSNLSPTRGVRILAKMESQNPAGSVKDRIAKGMIAAAEADGTLTPGRTMLDWMRDLSCPAILLTGSYLGAISHTLTALAALAARQVPVRTIVISESEASPVPMQDMLKSLQAQTALPIVTLPRLPHWKAAPDLTALVE